MDDYVEIDWLMKLFSIQYNSNSHFSFNALKNIIISQKYNVILSPYKRL